MSRKILIFIAFYCLNCVVWWRAIWGIMMARRRFDAWFSGLLLGTCLSIWGSMPAQAAATRKSLPVVKAKSVSHRSAKGHAVSVRHASFVHKPSRAAIKQQWAQRHERAAELRAMAPPATVSFGRAYGLHATPDALELSSSVALVVDQSSSQVLFSKNAEAVLPIASLTKLMTALVVLEGAQPLDESLSVTSEDVDTEKNSRSRLTVGTVLNREGMLHLALMSSENRAAHALGRNYPGGVSAFVTAMNRKAQSLGMRDSRFVEPTGLSSSNQSSARDLVRLVKAAHGHRLIRELSTSPEADVLLGDHVASFRNTNSLIRQGDWEIGLQKTGYIAEAGRCLVMQAKVSGRALIMVFLDSSGKHARLEDAERVRRWLTGQMNNETAQQQRSGTRAPVAS
jgi:serine-type D-Ala-D-Ala endopeptidase (penicillin-binding protein 7)